MKAGNQVDGANTPFSGSLPVATRGYHWRSGHCRLSDRTHEVLEAFGGASSSTGEGVLHYAPFLVGSLHRKLARVSPSRRAISKFAAKYGTLHHQHAGIGMGGVTGVTIDEWGSVIAGLAGVVDLQDALQRRELGKCSRIVRVAKPSNAIPVVISALVFSDRGIDFLASERASEFVANVVDGLETPAETPIDVARAVPTLIGTLEKELGPKSRMCVLAARSAVVGSTWWGLQWDRMICRWPRSGTGIVLSAGAVLPVPSLAAPSGNSNLIQSSHFVKFATPPEKAQLIRELLESLVSGALDGHVKVRASSNAPNGFAVIPDCVAAAAYVDLAFEMAGRTRRMRDCKYIYCGRAFQPSDSRQIYCDATCRRSAYYHRQATQLP
jgi:hypothetical protein